MSTKEAYIVTCYLDRDPGVADEELVRSLSDWKRMKDEGGKPPKWPMEAAPATLEGFLRLLTGPDVPFGILKLKGDNGLSYVALFLAPATWTSVLAQAMSSMAFGLRPGSYLDVSRTRSRTAAKDVGVRVSRRRFEIVLNGDGEPEVKEVKEVRVDA